MRATVRPSRGARTLELELPRGAVAAERLIDSSDAASAPHELLAASLAASTALTIDAYARRRGWELDEVVVEVDYAPAQRGSPTRCDMVVSLPDTLSREQCERLMQVGAKSPVHRTLEGEIVFAERIELRPGRQAAAMEVALEPRAGRARSGNVRSLLSRRR